MRAAAIPIEDPRWCEFTSSHPGATPFHLPAWATLIADCYRFEASALVVLDTDGEILAGIPAVAVRSPVGGLRWVSLPFTDSCTLLARQDADLGAATAALAEWVLAGRARELEVRSELPVGEHIHPVTVAYDYALALPADPADLHPSEGHRRNRNRASRMGVRVSRGQAPQDVATYYRLHTLTRQRQGVPVQPRRFFELISDRMISPGHGFVATATLEDEPLAAVLYLTHNGTLVAKYRASDPARQDTGAGFLVDWDMMVAACSEGDHTLDLGRTDLDAAGQRRYKTGWGATESPLVYSHVSTRAPAATHLRTGQLSRLFIRRSPLWVGRAVGAVLYRWTA